MDDTKRLLNNCVNNPSELKGKLHNLLTLLVALNASGSLSLEDYTIIEDYIKGAFGYALPKPKLD